MAEVARGKDCALLSSGSASPLRLIIRRGCLCWGEGRGDILLLRVADLVCHFCHVSGESPEQHGPHGTVPLHGERRCGWHPQTSARRSKPHAEGLCVGNQETQEVGARVFTVSRSVPSFQWHCWHQRSSSVVLMCPKWATSVSLLCSSPQMSFFEKFASSC